MRESYTSHFIAQSNMNVYTVTSGNEPCIAVTFSLKAALLFLEPIIFTHINFKDIKNRLLLFN